LVALSTRTLVLLRHGQYETNGIGALTPLGRTQAKAAAKFLEDMAIDTVWSSTLVRAKETADIVAGHLERPVRHSRSLREGMYTKVEGYDVPASERRDDRRRADMVYAKFFKKSRVDRTELLVCHGNLIRYLLCRAMAVPIARWIRMTTNHCSLTRIVVRDTGAVRVVSYNETSHLPRKLVT
jgi:serine/threonine-protein phosphatase PGAM5